MITQEISCPPAVQVDLDRGFSLNEATARAEAVYPTRVWYRSGEFNPFIEWCIIRIGIFLLIAEYIYGAPDSPCVTIGPQSLAKDLGHKLEGLTIFRG